MYNSIHCIFCGYGTKVESAEFKLWIKSLVFNKFHTYITKISQIIDYINTKLKDEFIPGWIYCKIFLIKWSIYLFIYSLNASCCSPNQMN